MEPKQAFPWGVALVSALAGAAVGVMVVKWIGPETTAQFCYGRFLSLPDPVRAAILTTLQRQWATNHPSTPLALTDQNLLTAVERDAALLPAFCSMVDSNAV